jgi:hypothetical protein
MLQFNLNIFYCKHTLKLSFNIYKILIIADNDSYILPSNDSQNENFSNETAD